jgi:hypothetical protein
MNISIIVKAFGEQAVKRTQVFDGFCMYENRVVSVEDARPSEHPSLSKIDENGDELK